MHCALNCDCHKAFWYGFKTEASSSRQKKKWNYRNNWKKISVKANCPTINFSEKNEPGWRCDQAATVYQMHRSVGSRKRFSSGMISLAARTFAWKKKWLKEVKENFSGFFFSNFVIVLFYRAYSAIMTCVTSNYFKVTLCKIPSVSFFWFFEIIFF